MSWTFNFPRNAAYIQDGIIEGLKYASGEIVEAAVECDRDMFDPMALAIEVMDASHAIETVLRNIVEFYGVDLDEACSQATAKNAERGYYRDIAPRRRCLP